MTNPPRHSWGPPTHIPHAIALPRKTERQCEKCGLVKVTWHEVDERGLEKYRTEFWRGLERVEGVGTPVCEAVEVLEGVGS
jgi:hypothetical protein